MKGWRKRRERKANYRKHNPWIVETMWPDGSVLVVGRYPTESMARASYRRVMERRRMFQDNSATRVAGFYDRSRLNLRKEVAHE